MEHSTKTSFQEYCLIDYFHTPVPATTRLEFLATEHCICHENCWIGRRCCHKNSSCFQREMIGIACCSDASTTYLLEGWQPSRSIGSFFGCEMECLGDI